MFLELQYEITSDRVFHYLGYQQNVPSEMVPEVEKAIAEARRLLLPKVFYREVRFRQDQEKKGFLLTEGLYLPANRAFLELAKSEFFVIAVLTLGETYAAWYEDAKPNCFRQLLLDAVGTAALEAANHRFEQILGEKHEKKGLALSRRFCPGEDGIPLEFQRTVFTLLKENLEGVTLNENLMIKPLKSLSLLYGVGRFERAEGQGCATCSLRDCHYRQSVEEHKVAVIDPPQKTIRVGHGENLFLALAKNGIFVPNSCGGNRSCGKCAVAVDSGCPQDLCEEEKELLGQERLAQGLRLACFVRVTGDMRVSVKEPIMAAGAALQKKPRGIASRKEKICGIAVDIGTTTLAAYLLDLETGKEIAACSSLNPQISYGADVITRINHTILHKEGLAGLQGGIVRELNRLTDVLCEQAGISRTEIHEVVAAGNTTMLHFLLGVPCRGMAAAPYTPVFTAGLELKARELGWQIHPGGRAVILPGIAAFAGADTLAALVACGMHRSEDLNLLVDIGTNGEMVLGNKERLVSCSAAAGPAFEGGRITCGMGGIDGAIDHVNFRWEVPYSVIGGGEPRGLCGSGLLDLVAQLLEYGIIEPGGRIKKRAELSGRIPGPVFAGLRQQGEKAVFFLEEKAGIYLAQQDIRELQLAKGAIYAGIKLLLKEMKISPAQVRHVYLAGGFGNFLDVESAFAVRLLPAELKGKTVPVGNAAGSGAKKALLSEEGYLALAGAKKKVEYLELSGRPDFEKEYLASLDF